MGPHQVFPYRETSEELFPPFSRGQTLFPAERLEGQDWRVRLPGGSGRVSAPLPPVRVKMRMVISRQPMEGGGSLTDLGERKASSFWGHCWCFINDKGCKTPPLSLQLMLKLNFLQLGSWKSPAIISEMLPVSRWGKKTIKKTGEPLSSLFSLQTNTDLL